MYDFQNTVLLTARPEKSTVAVRYLTLLLAAVGLLGCIWVNPLIFALPSILLIVLWWWTWFHTNIEYEYTYFDGGIDFDRIRDKRKRKSMISIHMDQVEQIAPVGDDSLRSVHQDKNVKFMDYSSRKQGRKFYEIIWKDSGDTICIRFEPDKKFLDSISIKYGRKVKR